MVNQFSDCACKIQNVHDMHGMHLEARSVSASNTNRLKSKTATLKFGIISGKSMRKLQGSKSCE